MLLLLLLLDADEPEGGSAAPVYAAEESQSRMSISSLARAAADPSTAWGLVPPSCSSAWADPPPIACSSSRTSPRPTARSLDIDGSSERLGISLGATGWGWGEKEVRIERDVRRARRVGVDPARGDWRRRGEAEVEGVDTGSLAVAEKRREGEGRGEERVCARASDVDCGLACADACGLPRSIASTRGERKELVRRRWRRKRRRKGVGLLWLDDRLLPGGGCELKGGGDPHLVPLECGTRRQVEAAET